MSEGSTDYYTKVTRSLLGDAKEVGAMPFILFQYYLTYQTAAQIKPSLQKTADDLGLKSKVSVCQHKKVLIDKGWITEKEGEIFIKKRLENLNAVKKNLTPVKKNLTNRLENLNAPYKEQNKHKNKQLEQTTEKENVSTETSGSFGLQAKEIFQFWQTELNHPNAKFTNERRLKVIARLKDDYTVEQIKMAVTGCHLSPFHQGQNESGIVHDDLELICRKAVNLDRFIGIYEANQNGATNGKQSKSTENLPSPAEFERKREEHRRNQNLDISQIRV